MTYNMTEVESARGFTDLFIAANNLSGGLFAAFFLLMLNLMMLMILKERYEFGAIMIGTNFSMSIIALIMWWLQALTFTIAIVPFLFLLISIFIYMFSKN